MYSFEVLFLHFWSSPLPLLEDWLFRSLTDHPAPTGHFLFLMAYGPFSPGITMYHHKPEIYKHIPAQIGSPISFRVSIPLVPWVTLPSCFPSFSEI